jgi:hypothetical protein
VSSSLGRGVVALGQQHPSMRASSDRVKVWIYWQGKRRPLGLVSRWSCEIYVSRGLEILAAETRATRQGQYLCAAPPPPPPPQCLRVEAVYEDSDHDRTLRR